jgi:hypothetical protein
MKNIFRFFACLLVAVLMARPHYAQEIPPGQDTREEAGTRENLSRQLVALRDSVNTMLGEISKQSSSAIEAPDPRYQKITHDLTRYKAQLDKTIDEVVNSKIWNDDMGIRTSQTLADVRREFTRIKSDFEEDTKDQE